MKQKSFYLTILLHWAAVPLVLLSATLAKQKELDGLPLNSHMVIGSALAFITIIRLMFHIKNFTKTTLTANIFYSILYAGIFFILATGCLIAQKRNLFGYLFNPNSAIGKGSFKLLADIHKTGWQILLGLVIVHVGMVFYSLFFKKSRILKHM